MLKLHILQTVSSYRVAIVLVLIAALVLPGLFLYPFHADIDIQQVMGFALYRYHLLPYLGSWDSNFPGTVLIHSAAIALWGPSEVSLRLADLLFQIGTIIALYKISRYWLDAAPALLGCALYAEFYINGPGQYISQRDCFAILPILLGIWMTIASHRSETSFHTMGLIGAGIFAGIAVWIRPTFGLLLFPPFVGLFNIRTIKGRHAFLFEILGFGTVVALGLFPFVLVPNGLHAIYFATIQYNMDVYIHAFSLSSYSRRVWIAVAFLAIWALAMIYHKMQGTGSRYKPKSRGEIQYLVAIIVALLAGVVVMRRLATYHFAPFFACFMPVLAAILWERLVRSFPRPLLRLAVAFAMLAIVYPWRILLPSFSGNAEYYSISSLFNRSSHNSDVAHSVARYINEHSTPWEAVDLATFTSPGPRWRIDRPFATRFTTIQALLTEQPDGTYTPYQKRWQAEYVEDLRAANTKFYIVDNPPLPKNQLTTLELLYTLPGLKQLLHDDFRLNTAIGNYLIYQRVS